MVEKADVVIIGAGVSGLSTAYELSKKGLNVLVIEKSYASAEASGRNPGGIRLLGRDEAEVPMMLEAMKRWRQLSEELDMDIGFRNDGYLWVALNEKEVALQKELVARDTAFGIDEQILIGQELWDFAPSLSKETVFSGLWSPGCSFADPFRVGMAYCRAAKRQGARFWFGTKVTGFTTQKGRITGVESTKGPVSTEKVIVAAGPWTKELCQMVGVDIPLTPKPYQVHLTEPLPWRILPLCNFISTWGFFWQSHRGHVYTGDTNTFEKNNFYSKKSDTRFMKASSAKFSKIVPALAPLKYIRSWSGIIDFSPDDNFIMENLKEPSGLIFACGYSGHGFALTPITGRLLAELALNGKTSFPTEPFSLKRFKEKGGNKQSHFAHQSLDEIHA